MTTELKPADGILQFLDKHRAAKGANAKELRFTIAEADRLVAGIAEMQDRYIRVMERNIELQESMLEDSGEITVSGGSFR
jgi:hypothetical protein